MRAFLSFFLFSPLASAVDIQTHFNKSLDKEALLGALSLEIPELIQYIEHQGVEVRFMNLESRTLTALESSILVSEDIANAWRKEYQREGVIGAYISPHLHNVKKPLLILTDLKSKWTLLHEFIHYLFEKSRLSSNPRADSDLAETQQGAREYFLEIYSKRGDPTQLENVIKVFCEFVEAEIALSKNVSLEEVTIEKLLIDLDNQKAVAGLDHEQKIIAEMYVKTNKRLFLGYLEKFAEIAAELKKHLQEKPHFALDNLAGRIQDLRVELQDL